MRRITQKYRAAKKAEVGSLEETIERSRLLKEKRREGRSKLSV